MSDTPAVVNAPQIIADALRNAGVAEISVSEILARVTHPAPRSVPVIDVVNASTVVTDLEAAAVVAALQIQVDRDFGPVWNMGALLNFVPLGGKVRAGRWGLIIMDDSDAQGALGYHDWTEDGLPIGKIFAKDDLKYGNLWSVTASHELLEMLGDPEIIRTVVASGRAYCLEVCDACEDDGLAYDINGIKVSDFVYPNWFIPWAPATSKFDYQGKITRPLQLLPGGYIGWTDDFQNWKQDTMQKASGNRFMHQNYEIKKGSRRDRRRLTKDRWTRSQSV